MTGWLLRLILLIIIIRMAWRFLNDIIEGASGPGRRAASPPEKSVPLVRDPVCGTFVVRARALTSGHGDDMQFFCSERCRTEYQGRRR